jgi:hypothetical protein
MSTLAIDTYTLLTALKGTGKSEKRNHHRTARAACARRLTRAPIHA